MKKSIINRGDLFYCSFGKNSGSVQKGDRPVLVIQADDYNRNAPTIIVAAVTGVLKKSYLPSHILLDERFGLKKPSMLLLEQIRTVNKDDLKDYIGRIDDDYLIGQINATLKKTLGLWFYKPFSEDEILCLCPDCRDAYLQNPKYIVRRQDPFSRVKEKCTKCGHPGRKYIISERHAEKHDETDDLVCIEDIIVKCR